MGKHVLLLYIGLAYFFRDVEACYEYFSRESPKPPIPMISDTGLYLGAQGVRLWLYHVISFLSSAVA